MPTTQNKDWMDLVNAGLGAYAGYQNAQNANQSRTTTTNQTTTQNPFGINLIGPDIEAALDVQRQLMEQGPAHIGGRGTEPTYGWGAQSAAPAGSAPARNAAGGGGASGGAGGGGGKPTVWTNARGQQMTLNAAGQAVPYRGGGAGAGAGAGQPQVNYADPHSVSAAVAQAGLNAGNDPTTRAAQQGVQNILSGQGGADSGGTGFQGYNPINDWLAQQLQGDVGQRDASNLLHQYLGVGNQSGADMSGGGYNGGGGGNNGPFTVVHYAGSGGSGSGGYGSSSGGGQVPDTVGNSNSYFATQLKQLMDSQANDADLQAVIDAANADTNRGLQQSLWGLDAQAQGTGRFGGDTYAGLSSQARSDAAKQMSNQASATRLGELQNRRALYENLLGQVNTRDLGAMNDATQRYGIDASAAASRAGSADAAAATKRAQDLQAIGMLMQNDQFGISQLGDLGGQLSQDQLGAIGLAPGLAGIGLSGLGQANNAAGNMYGMDAAHLQAQTSRGIANAQLNQQAQQYNAQAQQNAVNDYMRTILGIGNMGGTTTTTGTNVVPGIGVNPYAAGAYGGWAGYNNGGR